MSNKLVELGQRIERLKGHTLDNFVPSSSSFILEEEERNSPSSTSKGSEQFNWEREEEMVMRNILSTQIKPSSDNCSKVCK